VHNFIGRHHCGGGVGTVPVEMSGDGHGRLRGCGGAGAESHVDALEEGFTRVG
jgi:hypothetical protein